MTEPKPSLLRQKLDAKNTSSSSVKSMSSLWSAVGKASLKAVKPVLETELVISQTIIEKRSFEELKKKLTDSIPVFEFTSAGDQLAGFLYFSARLAATVTYSKLGGGADGDAETQDLSLLDLYLLDPMARNLLEAIDSAFSEIDSSGIFADLAFTARCLSLNELFSIDDEADFIQATFNLANPEQEQERADDLSVTYCFFYPMLEKLSVQVSRPSEDVLDFSNPWTEHMHSTVLATEVPISAVLENCLMSIGECSRFEIGQVINLPGSSLDMLTLKVQTKDGPVNMAFSALGVIKQHKAVQLLEDPSKVFIADLPQMMSQSSL